MLETPGLAKSAPIPISEPPILEKVSISEPPKPQPTLSTPSWEGIPVDTIRYLGKDIGSMTTKDIEQLRDIDKWSKQDIIEDTIGNRLQKLKDLELKLGAPGYYETKLEKMWNWVKMSFQINELRTRQKAFER